MTLSEDEKKLCEQLVHIIERINALMISVGEIPSNYTGFVKIKNIAENKDGNGFKNISFYLNTEARMLYDNRVCNNELSIEIEKAYLISDHLNKQSGSNKH